ncbi:MAG: sugar phosphate isomerase/epimerase family protein [Methanocella sp.]|jgi:sugar phosphate isomerase/epimerase
MSKPKVGVSMLYSLGDPFNRMVKRITTLETKTIEVLDDGDHELTPTRIASLKEVAKKHGLEYSIHAPFADVNIASPIKPMLTLSLKRVKQSIAHASALDAKLVVIHPGAYTGISSFTPGASWKQNTESLKDIYGYAEEKGVNIAIENLPAKYWFLMSSPQDFSRFYKETGLSIGIVLDLGHAHLEGQIEPFFNQIADKIVHVHASNNDGSDDQHNGVEDGTIDYNLFAENLKKIGYDKWVMVESSRKVPESLAILKALLV